ncbi:MULTISPECIES: hypothetical protein [Mycetohabitans]|uniref:Uncharacterized protein n=1 Tax=Mycetohabitans sp. TaxID=2571162 RepID=A0A6B9HDK1_9BURK|nr:MULTISPECIES: hypothetical protein [Mycetohabitans]MCG1046906.1 hypothetical protein [Mycetohabitans sp. B6]QGY72847.1 hypothetical protein [Mycetohabitans sp.]
MTRVNSTEQGIQLPLILESDPAWNKSLVGNRRDELIVALADLLLEALGKVQRQARDQGDLNEPEDHV